MNVLEAIQTVAGWLLQIQHATILYPQGKEVEPAHFQVRVQQLAPVTRERVFEIVPAEVPLCWNVMEV